MITQAYLTEWGAGAPWPTAAQIEQDLILSRLIVEIAGHPLLSRELRLRGGTCLHKLHLPTPYRYSEDLVRHEAPYDRAGMKGLRRGPVAAGS